MTAIKKTVRPKPVVLISIEGWGIAPAYSGNAITEAQPPYFNHLISHYPALSLKPLLSSASVAAGKSITNELSHLTIAFGQEVADTSLVINNHINCGDFENKLQLVSDKIVSRRLHIISLISKSNSEASLNYLDEVIQWLAHVPHQEIFLHVILDGRDMSSKGGQALVLEVEKKLLTVNGAIATITGRLYAMDLHQHESRIQKTIAALISSEGNQAQSSSEAFEESYKKKIFDEDFSPTIITKNGLPIASITSEDVILFLNFNSISIRSLAESLVESFSTLPLVFSFGDYKLEEKIHPLFSNSVSPKPFTQLISEAGFRQLRISDSEGFAAVTAFLNGGDEKSFSGEDRQLVSVPVVDSYHDTPTFNNEEVTKETVKAIEENKYDFIAVNFSNVDRVAHQGNISAAQAAIISIDTSLNKIIAAILETSGVAIVVGSHGLAEQMNEQPSDHFLPHTTNMVPFILAGKPFAGYSLGLPEAIGGDLSILSPAGSLLDIAPTILKLLRLPIPKEMTGKSFFDELRLV
ncbi:MAG TPA: alkaline phosphatase family protein [bacterium]|nr:alkaline phosphatase family protein [bacterium]